jgi:tetratricopeptide (TPR) repeat protein
MDDRLSETQPNQTGETHTTDLGETRPQAAQARAPEETTPATVLPAPRSDTAASRTSRRAAIIRWIAWGAVALLLLGAATLAGGFSGYRSAVQARSLQQSQETTQNLVKQYQLGVQDLQDGRFEIARQRFEWLLEQAPDFPGAADRLNEALVVLNATSTPTPIPPTPTPTATPDPRPVQEQFAAAQSAFDAGDWNGAIEALVNLRGRDAGYQVTQVDRMLYVSLRFRGVTRILESGDLEGGGYDLALAERFGPLDIEAQNVRGWARLYQYGSAFWGADPATAVYYFGQLAAAAPGLHDASGWTARERYYAALQQYGDLLAAQGDWCAAEEQYRLALSQFDDANLQATMTFAALECAPPTDTPIPTEIPTATATPTLVPSATLPGSPTPLPTTPIPSDTPPSEPSPTLTEEPPRVTDTPTPSPTTPGETSTPEPSATPSPTLPPTEPGSTSAPEPTQRAQ